MMVKRVSYRFKGESPVCDLKYCLIWIDKLPEIFVATSPSTLTSLHTENKCDRI